MTADVLAQRSELREKFDRLVEETMAEVKRYAHSLCNGDEQLAHDLYQEAWLVALRKFPTLTDINQDQFTGFFKRAIKYLLKGYNSRRLTSLDAFWDEPGFESFTHPALRVESNVDSIVDRELSPAMTTALASLPPRHRQIFLLFAGGAEDEEAAATMGLEVSGYRSLLEKARQELRTALEPKPDHTEPAEPVPSPAGDWLTMREMARRIGRPHQWVRRHIGPWKASAEPRLERGGRTTPHYPPHVLVDLKAESDEQRQVLPAGDWLTVPELAKTLGCSKAYVRQNVRQFANERQDRLDSAGRKRPHYPPNVLLALGGDPRLLSQSKPSRRWYTVAEMSQELGRPEDWVALRAGPFALLTEESETQTGQQILRYPAEVLDALRKCAARSEGQSKTWKVLPAGDWLTQTAIARKLGRGERPWVSNRLGAFKDLCEPRLGPKGLVYLHYPPVVARALLEESKRLADLPAQGDWLTEKGIAQNIGRSQAWVAKRIGQFKHLAEDRLDPAARIFVCYPAHVADALRRLSEEEVSWPPIGDWYTVFGLAKAIGRRWAWVDSRLGPYRHLSEPRVDDQGVCRDCYPPQVKEALEDVSQSERNAKPKPGWLSIPALASALGRSAPWVAKRLGPYLHLGEEMPNKQGRLFPYYPPSVLEALRKQDEEEMARRADLLYHWRHA